MKIKNLKYIFVFLLCILLLSCCFAVEEVNDPSQCSSVNNYGAGLNYSSTPVGNVYSVGLTDNPNRYYNNRDALTWYAQDHGIQNVDNVITYKVLLLAQFDGGLGVSTYSEVWHLQNALGLVQGCSVRKDCKLGTQTSSTFFSCNICEKIGYYTPQNIGPYIGSEDCGENRKKLTSGSGADYCCRDKCPSPLLEEEDKGDNSYLITEGEWSGFCYKACPDGELLKNGDSCADGYKDSTADNHCCQAKTCTEINANYIDKEGDCDVVSQYPNCCKKSCQEINPDYTPKPEGGQCAGELKDVDGVDYCCQPKQCESPYLPSSEGGACGAGYASKQVGDLSCCTLCCGGEKQVLSGDNAGSSSCSENQNCKECEEGTVPNENHTKCICDSSKKCCGIQLNTVVPFIGDCIEMNSDSSRGDTTSVTSVTAFPILMQGLMKILMSAIMVFSFLMVIIAGLSMTTGAFGGSGFTKGKTILKNVIISLILLGCSGLILSLINPNFFGG